MLLSPEAAKKRREVQEIKSNQINKYNVYLGYWNLVKGVFLGIVLQ